MRDPIAPRRPTIIIDQAPPRSGTTTLITTIGPRLGGLLVTTPGPKRPTILLDPVVIKRAEADQRAP